MGIISVTQMNELYWLGRYTERVYTTLRLFSDTYDKMLDRTPEGYKEFCRRLEIPDVYGSRQVFLEKYPFDENDPNSIISNLNRAYDNAILLREEIGSEPLSYIQLCVYAIRNAKDSAAPLLRLQDVIDNILAFWGIADDMIDSEQSRDILQAGVRLERLDIYGRLHADRERIDREIKRLKSRLIRSGLPYDTDWMSRIEHLVLFSEIDYDDLVRCTEVLVRG